MNTHDLGYTKLFSHARMVEDLVAGFIQEAWVTGLDFTTLEKMNPLYVTDDFRKRIDDLVWKIRWQGTDRWLFIYLILEPQSTVDDMMAIRNDLYLMLLYQDLRASGKIPEGQKFPPVVPIVLYNGISRWTAAMDVSDLIEESPPGMEVYRPHMRYLLVSENHYQEGVLKTMHNVVAALFRLEKSRSIEDIKGVVRELDEWLKGPGQQELRRAFAKWLSRILLPRLARKTKIDPESIPEMDDLQEVHTMLAETAEGWTRQWKLEGMAEMLLNQLQERFGTVPDWVSSQLAEADLDTLKKWGKKIFDAKKIEQIFQ